MKTSSFHMIKHSKCWRMTGTGQAALELSSFKRNKGIIKEESPHPRNYVFGNARLVSMKMTSHMTSHNFQILKIEIFSKPCMI